MKIFRALIVPAIVAGLAVGSGAAAVAGPAVTQAQEVHGVYYHTDPPLIGMHYHA